MSLFLARARGSMVPVLAAGATWTPPACAARDVLASHGCVRQLCGPLCGVAGWADPGREGQGRGSGQELRLVPPSWAPACSPHFEGCGGAPCPEGASPPARREDALLRAPRAQS